jgi:DNA-directed RNA polymerase specialized sigma24 family protein
VLQRWSSFQKYVELRETNPSLAFVRYKVGVANKARTICRKTLADNAQEPSYADYATDYTKEQVEAVLPLLWEDSVDTGFVAPFSDEEKEANSRAFAEYKGTKDGLNTRNWGALEEARLFKAAVKEVYTGLTPKQQKLLFLRYGLGLPFQQVADELDMRLKTTYEAVSSALTSLRTRLGVHL